MNNFEYKQQILKKIEEYNKIIITRHIRPDGDCIGSSIGLREIIKASYPSKVVYSIGDDKADYLDFINTEDDQIADEEYKDALIIVVDTSNKNRISNSKIELGKEIIKIDHHINVEDYGTVNYVREEYPACSLIITDLYNTFSDKLKLTKEAATALYVGVVTDTGRFRYQGINGETLGLAGMLLDMDIDTEKIYTYLYTKEKATLKLQGFLYNNFITTKNGVSYIIFTKKIQKKYKVNYEEAASLVNALDGIKGSLIWIAFIELDDSIRVRLRSRYVAIDKLANQYNGGGHANACGASLKDKKQIKNIVNDADMLLKEFKANNPKVF